MGKSQQRGQMFQDVPRPVVPKPPWDKEISRKKANWNWNMKNLGHKFK
jgi:hypothetical protein